MRSSVVLFFVGIAFTASAWAVDPVPSAPVTAAAVLAEFDRMAALPLWPNFAPAKVPLAVYDGERTWLVRHPSPPEGFVAQGNLLAYPGQHPVMRANTSVELGGVQTATLLLDPGQAYDAKKWAAVLIHESFHVFQRDKHPTWHGNEAQLFLYPMDDAETLALRRLESEALRRALAAPDKQAALCWTSRALASRRERFVRLRPELAAYERGTELNEGLAAFIEGLAFGGTAGPELPADEYPADQVRNRAYAIGQAWAALLDRFDPAWRGRLESGEAASLDEELAAKVGRASGACGFSPAETTAARERAKVDVSRLAGQKREAREAFVYRQGWRVEVIATGTQPFFPQGFDPLNISVLGNGEVLHRRWVKLGNGESTLEVLGRETVTQGAGSHPLFDGVKKVVLTGLSAGPKVEKDGDFLVIEGEGLKARLKGAMVEGGEGELVVKWP